MRWCLSALIVLAIAGVAVYGSNRDWTIASSAGPAVEATERSLAVWPAREATTSTVTAARAEAALVSKPGERGRVAMYRGETLIGWVVPDQARVQEAAAAPSRKAATSGSGGGRVNVVDTGGRGRCFDGRGGGTVWNIKSGLRDSIRQRFYQKPSWVGGRANSAFQDRADRRYNQR